MSHHHNKVRIKAVVQALAELNENVVFIGGASISLYASETDLPDHRATDDVDVIIEMTTLGQYVKINERLRSLGFKEDIESNVICRWKLKSVIVDIMPINDRILGFTNAWYEKAFPERIKITLDEVQLYILPVHLLILTKWEALLNRNGGTDWRWSHDFEDIIKVMLANDQWQLSKLTDAKYEAQFIQVLTKLLSNKAFLFEACRAHLNRNFYSDDNIRQLISQIEKEIR